MIKGTSLAVCDQNLQAEINYQPAPLFAPDLKKLPYKCDGPIKTFELTAMEVFTLFHKGFFPGPLYTWGYNGSMPGPVMEAFEGERVRIKFKNELPEPTTIHWHGLELPIDMDGASGFSHPPIPPGGSFTYEFDLKQSGTYMYHSGHGIAKQLAMGLSGFFIIHPKKAPAIEVDKDFLLFLQMWTVPPHSIIPDTMDMMFNYFTVNGKTAPSTTPLQVETGEKVRLRFANISMMQHPFHLHGHTWKVVATGAGDNNPSTFVKGNTVLVPVGQTLDVIVEDIKEEGDWLLHCHLPHHVTNNMEIDPVPGEPMHHGEAGMFTVFKVGSHHPKPPHDHGHTHRKEDPSSKEGGHKHHKGPKIGFYEGHIKFENDKVFEISFDLHKVQEGAEWRKLRANLKIKLPNHNHSKNNEYLLYYYEHLKYNFKKQRLYLEEDEDYSLTLQDLTFHRKNHQTMLMGQVYSPFSGLKGTLHAILKKKKDLHRSLEKPKTPPHHEKKVIRGLEGEYRGQCFQKTCHIQIETARGIHSPFSGTMTPYHHYLIKGRIGILHRNILRIDAVLKDGVFNPFQGNLNFRILKGQKEDSLDCKVSQQHHKQVIKCEGIQVSRPLKMSMKKKTPPLPFHLKTQNSPKVNQLTDLSLIKGVYSGYVKLPHGPFTLPLKLSLITKKVTGKPMKIPVPHTGGSLKIMTSGNRNAHSLNLKLKERPWLDSSAPFTKGESFLTLSADHKLYLVISKWHELGLEGHLYHKDFGKVGPFQLTKGKTPLPLPPKLRNLTSLSGIYANKNYQLKLSINKASSKDDRDGNPFFPLIVQGHLKNKLTNKTISIEHGTFNLFNNQFSFLTKDKRLIRGVKNGSTLSFFLPSLDKRRVRLVPRSQNIQLEYNN